MLDRLVRADRTPEGPSVPHVLEQDLVHAVGRADGLGTLERQRQRHLRFDVRLGTVDRAHDGIAGHLDVLETDSSESA